MEKLSLMPYYHPSGLMSAHLRSLRVPTLDGPLRIMLVLMSQPRRSPFRFRITTPGSNICAI
jgi:hypothetical protein